MMRDWSRRVGDIESFKVMELLAHAKALEAQGRDVIHMEVGEPDFTTAEPIVAAAQAALAAGKTQYTPALGIPELRRAIARFYQQRYGIALDPARVVVTPGASGALLLVAALLANPGESLMMSDPGYPCNPQFLRLVEASGQLVPVTAESNFQLTPALIDQHWTSVTAGVLLASPANPTGSVLEREELAEIASSVRARGGHLVVDELYHGLTYGMDAASVLEVDDNAFVLNSFSKYFGMTGWRLGWLVAPESAVPHLEKLAQNLFISPPTVAQYAALAAFEPETLAILEARRHAFAERRDYLVPALRKLGFQIPVTPQGAFYIYAGAGHLTEDAFSFCWRLLEEEAVAVTPGLDFGNHDVGHYIRFAYTTSVERLGQAVARLERFISRNSGASA